MKTTTIKGPQFRPQLFLKTGMHMSEMENVKAAIRALDLEMFIWIGALAFLALYDPTTGTDFTICPFRLLDIDWCPGCGLGRSVSFLLHGDIGRSFGCHVLGIPAICILLMRVMTLLKSSFHRNPSTQH